MPSQKNIDQLEKIKEQLAKAQAVFFVDYQGLNHKALEELRQNLSGANAEIKILKNTLVDLALQDMKIDAKEQLAGPRAALFAYEDAIIAAKVLQKFAKTNELLGIKFGIYESELIDETKIMELASLPSRDELLGKVVGIFKSPLSSLVYDLNFPITRLALALKEIERKKQAAS